MNFKGREKVTTWWSDTVSGVMESAEVQSITLPPPCLTTLQYTKSCVIGLGLGLGISNFNSSVRYTFLHSSVVHWLCFRVQTSLFFLF